MTTTAMSLEWPTDDFSRIPFAAYLDEDIYVEEQERIFRGPVWSYLALEAEIPGSGDFITTYVGDTPVLVNRQRDGEVSAFVNRCMHRGSMLKRECRGNATMHTCLYHQWAYDLTGRLRAVPFAKGHQGRGGLPPDFDIKSVRLTSLRVESYRGRAVRDVLRRHRAAGRLPGRQCAGRARPGVQPAPSTCSATSASASSATGSSTTTTCGTRTTARCCTCSTPPFGLYRPTQRGGVKLDGRGRHNISYSMMGTSDDEADAEAFLRHPEGVRQGVPARGSLDAAVRQGVPRRRVADHPVDLPQHGCAADHQQPLQTRQIQTRGPGELELYWTYFGYDDDDEEMTKHRLNQANLVGPGGLISMEDGEAVEMVHRAVKREQDEHGIVEIGGKGEIGDHDYLVTEIPIRGFWSYYYELMGIETEQAA